MRHDSQGFFWHDEAKVKRVAKEVVKCVPPPRTWESPDYLPGLQAALDFKPDLFTDYELGQASEAREYLIWDIECYPNYFLVGFKSVKSGKIVYFELCPELGLYIDYAKLHWVLHNFILVDFNGRHYDAPMAALCLAGATTEMLFEATEKIIIQKIAPWRVLRSYKVKKLEINEIDLKEIPPTEGSLKKFAGRLHCKWMQDLPFKPGTHLSAGQIVILRHYWCNDLNNTELLYNFLKPNIALREKLMQTYKSDMRSRSDAQIAEDIFKEKFSGILGREVKRPNIPVGTIYKYKVPSYLRYETPIMQWVLEQVTNTNFEVIKKGSDKKKGIIRARGIYSEGLVFKIANSEYSMGIGGLHSREQSSAHVTDDNFVLIDLDVASFYPSMILNLNMFPKHLGIIFISIFRQIVEERLGSKDAAKKYEKEFVRVSNMPDHIRISYEDFMMVADSLKIVINGTFGKLGDMFSILFSPDLMIGTTVGGQLTILMLVERLELAHINVVSGNTDGIVVKCHRSLISKLKEIVAGWEKDTTYKMEETNYEGIFSRDINNYFAVKHNGEVKVKGVYSEKGSNGNTVLSKNPTNLICSDAVGIFLSKGTKIEDTIMQSDNIRRFVSIRNVEGGAVKDGVFLGSMIRTYYSKNESGPIIYAESGKKVPRSDGAKPCMTLPDSFPDDINYDWYIQESYKILNEIGYHSVK